MNVLIQTVTLLCLLALLLELLFVAVNCFLKSRAERITFLRSFKKGKFAIIYITAIPLYLVGHLYNGQNFFKAFFSAVNKIINLVVLKYDTGSIDALIDVDPFYSFTVYFTFTLVGLNALLFTLSLTNQHIWSGVHRFLSTVTGKDRLYLLGNNESNAEIYKSDRRHSKHIVGQIGSRESELLYLEKLHYLSVPHYELFIKRLFAPSKWCRFLVKRHEKKLILVINTGSDEQNMAVARTVIQCIEQADEAERNKLFNDLRVYVFGEPRYETVYFDIIAGGYGCLHYVNKYQKVAIDFIDRYPFSQFMDERHLDYDTALVRSGVEINALLIGFGATNRQIFMTSVANNQFLTEGEDGPVLKPVRYHIFDRGIAENNKNLNHSYYRYKYELPELSEEDYLPLPALPAEEIYHHLDINDRQFYQDIRSIVTRAPNDVNFIVIGFGTDLENIDMAQKLVEKRKEWKLENLFIFVKARAWHKQDTLLEEDHCYFIGNEKDVVYSLDKIMGDRLLHMAQLRNAIYDIEYTVSRNPDVTLSEEDLEASYLRCNREWYTVKPQMQRESSLYACLSLRSKLHLFGLDYCDAGMTGVPALTEEDYLNCYAKDDRPLIDPTLTVDGKPIIAYPLDFRSSKRGNLAIHEHQRWNSFMISKGMIPSDIREIMEETDAAGKHTNGKNYAVRRHGNLTTTEGLLRFRRMLAERDGGTEAEYDVIKYDYQLLDDAYWLLTRCGYKLVRKGAAPKAE